MSSVIASTVNWITAIVYYPALVNVFFSFHNIGYCLFNYIKHCINCIRICVLYVFMWGYISFNIIIKLND